MRIIIYSACVRCDTEEEAKALGTQMMAQKAFNQYRRRCKQMKRPCGTQGDIVRDSIEERHDLAQRYIKKWFFFTRTIAAPAPWERVVHIQIQEE